jgi:hypothetical protein
MCAGTTWDLWSHPHAGRAVTLVTVTESDFQSNVVELAHLQGWWSFHPHDSRRSAPGWPDLVLLRPPEALFVEVKTDRGRLSPVQVDVLDTLRECALEVHVWRPRDWPSIELRLRRVRTSEALDA